MSDVDQYLSSLDTTSPFVNALLKNGLPASLITSIIDVMKQSYPQSTQRTYHTLIHSTRTANLMALMIDPASSLIPEHHAIALIIAAIFHDADPDSAHGNLVQVSHTLHWLKHNKQVCGLFEQFHHYGVAKAHVEALIMFTDYSFDPKNMKTLQKHAEQRAQATHDNDEDVRLTITWGKALAFADQMAMYVGTVMFANAAVKALAHEIWVNVLDSSDYSAIEEAIVGGTGEYLRERIENPLFSTLPKVLQENAIKVLQHFDESSLRKK